MLKGNQTGLNLQVGIWTLQNSKLLPFCWSKDYINYHFE